MVSTTFQPSYREHVRALRAINGVLPQVRWAKRIGWVSLAVGLLLALSGQLPGLRDLLVLVAVVVAAIFGVLPYWMAWLGRSQSPIWASEQQVKISDRGIEHSAAGADGLIAWPGIVRVAETRRFLLFFSSPQCAHYIPKAAFSPEQLVTIRSLVEGAGRPSDPSAAPIEPHAPAAADPRSDDVAYARFAWDRRETYRVLRLVTKYGYKKWFFYIWMALLGVWTGGPTVYQQWKEGGLRSVSLTVVLLSLFPLLLVLAIGPIVSWWYAWRLPRSQPSVRGPITVAVGPDGIRHAGGLSAGEVPWSALAKAVETPDFFLFFVSKLQAIYLPKAHLSDAASVARVRELLGSRVGDRFRQRG